MPDSAFAVVIEQETLLALEIQDVLAEAGLPDCHYYRDITEAEADFTVLTTAAVAIVEARLGAAAVVAFTERLAAAGVPVVVMSADRAATTLFPRAAPLLKPFDAAGLLQACDAARGLVS